MSQFFFQYWGLKPGLELARQITLEPCSWAFCLYFVSSQGLTTFSEADLEFFILLPPHGITGMYSHAHNHNKLLLFDKLTSYINFIGFSSPNTTDFT
jgi:hypothetical protein